MRSCVVWLPVMTNDVQSTSLVESCVELVEVSIQDYSTTDNWLKGLKVMSEIISKYIIDIKKHILEDIMPFWDRRCLDREYGGYITCFDREGNITSTNKYIWFQGRQLY